MRQEVLPLLPVRQCEHISRDAMAKIGLLSQQTLLPHLPLPPLDGDVDAFLQRWREKGPDFEQRHDESR